MKNIIDNIEASKNAYNSFAEKYFEEFFDDWEGKEFIDEFLQKLSGKKILDLGCGNGNFCYYATQKGFEVKGYDISEKMIQVGKSICPKLDLSIQDISSLPIEPELFDGAIYSYSFMHLTKEQGKNSLQSLHKNLKDHALISIMTCKGTGEVFIACDEFNKDKKMLFTFYEEDEIKKLLHECNYKIISMKIKHEENANISPDDWIILAEKINH